MCDYYSNYMSQVATFLISISNFMSFSYKCLKPLLYMTIIREM